MTEAASRERFDLPGGTPEAAGVSNTTTVSVVQFSPLTPLRLGCGTRRRIDDRLRRPVQPPHPRM